MKMKVIAGGGAAVSTVDVVVVILVVAFDFTVVVDVSNISVLSHSHDLLIRYTSL